MNIKPGDKWVPLGLSTQEAMGVVVGAIKEVNEKLDEMEERAKKELKEAGVFIGQCQAVESGFQSPERE